MKTIILLNLFLTFFFGKLFSQHNVEFRFLTSPIQSNLLKKKSEFNIINTDDVPYPVQSANIDRFTLFGGNLTYNLEINKSAKFKNGVSLLVANYQIVANNQTFNHKEQNILFNLYSGVEMSVLSFEKSNLNLDFTIEIPLSGNFNFRFKDHTFINAEIGIDDEIKRVDFDLNNRFDNYSAPYTLNNFLSTLFSVGLNYNLRLNEKNSLKFITIYQTTLFKPFSLEYYSVWKRPGDDFFTKVERTETSRFNFGFMNVGVSYVYHFKMKEK